MPSTIADTGLAARRKSYDLLMEKADSGELLSSAEITIMLRFEAELKSSGRDLATVFINLDQVAEYTGYKVRTIYNWVQNGKLARLADNTIERVAVDALLKSKGRLPQVPAYNGAEEGEGDLPGPLSARQEETRFRKARADREELLVSQLRGEVVEVSEVERQFTMRAHEYKTTLLLLSRRCAHKIAAAAGIESKEVTHILDKEVKELLAKLCRKVRVDVN